MTKEIVAIWAEDQHRLIGKDGHLPWHLPKELQYFKETTMGQVLLMGRVTFDGMGRRCLPGRETLVMTQQTDLDLAVKTFTSPETVIDWFNQQDKTLFIVGGATIYKLFEPYYDRLMVTTVHGSFDGDTYFPEIDFSVFDKIAEQTIEADEQNSHAFTLSTYIRKPGRPRHAT